MTQVTTAQAMTAQVETTQARATQVKNSILPVFTGKFVLLVLGLSVVVLVSPLGLWSSLLLVNALALTIWIVDSVLALKPSKVGFVRSLPMIVSLGAEAELEWQVNNPTAHRLKVAFADELPPSLQAVRRRVQITVPSEGRVTATTKFCPKRRGRFEISRVVMRTYGPLGLGGRQGSWRSLDILRVFPSFRSRREAELRIEKARILEVGLRSVRGHGGGTEFEQLREYSIDDDFRRIDWAATARAVKPIVRTYRAERNQNVMCLLDCGRSMAGRVDDIPRLEHAMDAVMAITTVASRLGDRVGLIAFDSGVRAEVALGQGNSQTATITKAMYQLEPSLKESNYRATFVRLLARFRRRSLVIVFTELSEQAVNEYLVPALGLLARRHVVIIASVSDPDVETWARAVPLEANKAFRKAAAVGSLHDRRQITATLRAKGVTVVDAEPGKLAAQLADAYLKIKATSRL